MAAYMIAQIDVQDEQLFEQYRAAMPAVLAQFGGRYVVRGGPVLSLEGPPYTLRVVVIEFPDSQAAQNFYASPDYQPLLAMREAAARTTLIIASGV